MKMQLLQKLKYPQLYMVIYVFTLLTMPLFNSAIKCAVKYSMEDWLILTLSEVVLCKNTESYENHENSDVRNFIHYIQ